MRLPRSKKPKVEPMKRRRQSERDKPTYVVPAITEWGWSYSFGINDTDLLPGPYWGTDHLEVSGDALLPSGLTEKPIELTLVPGGPLTEQSIRWQVSQATLPVHCWCQ